MKFYSCLVELLILLVFISVRCDTKCRAPYTCLPPKECASKIQRKGEILFKCSESTQNVCCPPGRTPDPVRNRTDPGNIDMNQLGFNMQTVTTDLIKEHRNYKMLVDRTCGYFVRDRVTEGKNASLDQFPWMALLAAKATNGQVQYICGGSLINNRYVLTAAHCVEGNVIDHIRLGEHQLYHDPDCNAEEYCHSPVDILPDEIIPHKNWNNPPLKNDIALIRLAGNGISPNKEYIKPICLPINLDELNITDSSKLQVAGWGKTDYTDLQGSPWLQFAELQVSPKDQCVICDTVQYNFCPLGQEQLCMQGIRGVDVCKGDSGGPLMTFNTERVYQIGLVSFKSVEICGLENVPSIFTRIFPYIPWILDNMKE